ncbi:MAG: DMT family transporter, partial [Bacteroidota bacterium]
FSLVDRDFIGMVASLAAAFFHAVTVVLFKSEGDNFSKNEILFYQNILGFLILFPFFEYTTASPKDYALGIAYGVLTGLIGYGLFFYGLKRLMASTASALMYMEVVSAVTLGYLFLGERLSGAMIIGGMIVVGSSFLLGQLRARA